jgi:hypothetical protein
MVSASFAGMESRKAADLVGLAMRQNGADAPTTHFFSPAI